jgi:hypothetical protein
MIRIIKYYKIWQEKGPGRSSDFITKAKHPSLLKPDQLFLTKESKNEKEKEICMKVRDEG